MGFEDEVEQSIGRPCRQLNGRSKRHCELTSSIVPRGTSFHRRMELEFPPIGFDPVRLSCCCRGLFPCPAELGAVYPDAVHDHSQSAGQRHNRLLVRTDIARTLPHVAEDPKATLPDRRIARRTEPSPLIGAELTHITESFYGARARNRASSASNSAMRRSRAASAAASKRCGMCCEQFASHAETAKRITRSGRAL